MNPDLPREKSLQKLSDQVFDVCIIGAGASGAGAALDAALRGFSVLLLDQGDFASGTSSKSTKLIHGGVRYLEKAVKQLNLAQFQQVRHGLSERSNLLHNAPHLTRPLPLLTPVCNRIEGLYFAIGLRLYDWIAGRRSTLPRSKWLSKQQTLVQFPALRNTLHSAVLYWDGQFDDARFNLALVASAVESGAVAVNYLALQSFHMASDGRITGAEVVDRLSGRSYQVQAKVFLNCAGPFADAIRKLANPLLPPRLRPSKGVHVVLPAHYLGHPRSALLIPKTADGRVVFAVPAGNHLIVGTTDDDYSEMPHEPVLETAEVKYLLDTLNEHLHTPLTPHHLQAGYGGLRPLIGATGKKSTEKLVRDHEVEWDEKSGLVSLLGGKWTTYRLMAADAVDQVGKMLNVHTPCKTRHHVLVGGKSYRTDGWENLLRKYPVSPATARHLQTFYGDQAEKVLEWAEQDTALLSLLHPEFPHIQAEVLYAVYAEQAVTLRDVLARRLRIETASWEICKQCVGQVAALMAPVLNWSEQSRQSAEKEYLHQLEHFQVAAGLHQGQNPR